MNVAFTILVVLIILAAILLIVVVLLQNGKDGGLATNFTSANQALGVRQTATILEKATWYLVAFILVLAIGIKYGAGDAINLGFTSLSGLALAALVGVILNAVLPGKDYEFGANPQGDKAVNFEINPSLRK